MYVRAARFYDGLYSFKDYAAEAAHVVRAIRARKPDARSLLDVACGTGKHLEHFRTEFDCRGLDLSPELLEVARQRLPGLPLHEADMVDFDLPDRFDAVTCLFSAIGYAVTKERMRAAVASMARHLAPGGVLVIEPWFSPDAWNVGHVALNTVDEPGLKVARFHIAEPVSMGRLKYEYTVATPEGVEHFTEVHHMGWFTGEQYLAAFRDAGLRVEHDPVGPAGRGLYIGVTGA